MKFTTITRYAKTLTPVGVTPYKVFEQSSEDPAECLLLGEGTIGFAAIGVICRWSLRTVSDRERATNPCMVETCNKQLLPALVFQDAVDAGVICVPG